MIDVGTNKESLEIMEFLIDFDQTVNPFSKPEVDIKDPVDFGEMVNFELFSDSKGNSTNMSMGNKNVLVDYTRSKDESDPYLIHRTSYDSAHNTRTCVTNSILEKDKSNIVHMNIFQKGINNPVFDLELDLIFGLAYGASASNGEGKPITEEEKEAVILELKRATAIANSVTSNMTIPRTPGVAKAYVPQPPVEQ